MRSADGGAMKERKCCLPFDCVRVDETFLVFQEVLDGILMLSALWVLVTIVGQLADESLNYSENNRRKAVRKLQALTEHVEIEARWQGRCVTRYPFFVFLLLIHNEWLHGVVAEAIDGLTDLRRGRRCVSWRHGRVICHCEWKRLIGVIARQRPYFALHLKTCRR